MRSLHVLVSLINFVIMFCGLFTFLLVLLCDVGEVLPLCMRDQSRIVRKLVRKEVLSAFESVSKDIPLACPFHPDLDLYLPQEDHKTMETVAKWVCEFCGKAFTTEFFIDRHFDNRHADRISQERDKVCLSDYCDIFRCDVVSSRGKADFWQVALCIEDELTELREKCQNTMDLCIPAHVSRNTSDTLRGMLYTGVCSYLTCHAYWETPFPQESQTYQILYVMACVAVLFTLIMYYCVVFNYYYSDEWDHPVNSYNEQSAEAMLWRPRAQYDPIMAAQQRPRVAATRRKAQHCPGSTS